MSIMSTNPFDEEYEYRRRMMGDPRAAPGPSRGEVEHYRRIAEDESRKAASMYHDLESAMARERGLVAELDEAKKKAAKATAKLRLKAAEKVAEIMEKDDAAMSSMQFSTPLADPCMTPEAIQQRAEAQRQRDARTFTNMIAAGLWKW